MVANSCEAVIGILLSGQPNASVQRAGQPHPNQHNALRIKNHAEPVRCNAWLGVLLKFPEFVEGELDVVENLAEEPDTNGFTGMDRHYRTSPIWMLKELVAALDSHNLKASLEQGRYYLLAANSWDAGH